MCIRIICENYGLLLPNQNVKVGLSLKIGSQI